MTHDTLHLFYVEHRVAVHHPFDVFVLGSRPLDANVPEYAMGDGFTHPLELRAGESLLREVVVWVLACFMLVLTSFFMVLRMTLSVILYLPTSSCGAFISSPLVPVVFLCLATRSVVGFAVSS